MKPEHWHKIVDLAESATQLSIDDRSAFLAHACVGNDPLRREVESLLVADGQAQDFIETPVARIAAELIADEQIRSMSGQEVGAYKIVGLLGVGGMGEVYLAHDKRLGRKVALKFLPDYLTSDNSWVQRFETEARAASALNHPNILTVYEVGQSAGTQFIATEFVEGKTLRQHLETGPLTVVQTLEVAIQVASALAVAHQAGIVHRDIKPENIMLRPDGYIKVLDFGVAKISEQGEPKHEADLMFEAGTNTQKGLVLGTPHYMSPEQARGEKVDVRTDIFSFGAVIYEMLTRRKPFAGETASHVVVEILEKDPPAISALLPAIPAELEDVVSKALQKNPQARYQTVAELVQDLRNIRHHHLGMHDEKEQGNGFQLGALSVSALGRKTTPSTSEIRTAAKTWPAYLGSEVRHHWTAIVFVTLATLAVALTIGYFWRPGRQESIDSVAILPFTNVGADSNLSDGIALHLTNRLSQLPNLTVISNNAAARYQSRTPRARLDLQDVGHELKVQSVVIGNVAQQGNHLNVSVELIDVRNNRHLWGEQYDRNATDILEVQEEITKAVSERLRPNLTLREENQLSKRYTESAQAYQCYLRGRSAWNKRTEPELRKGIDFFNEAIGIDPRYSLAYAGLADSYMMLAFHGGLSPRDYYPLAKAAAARALEIDDSIAEAHTALAYVKVFNEWDWQGAEVEFKRAIELSPNYATAHQWYGEFLGNMGRDDDALVERQKALRLDPLSPIITTELGYSYYQARRLDQALEQFRKAAELYPDFSPAHDFLAAGYERVGLYDQAIGEAKKAMALSGDNYLIPELAFYYARAGRQIEARKLLAEIVQNSQHRYYAPTMVAKVYTALGETDKAFEWLEKAYDQRDWGLLDLKCYPFRDLLRSDPRYADLMKRMNFPQ